MKKSVTVALMLLSQACITDLGVDAPDTTLSPTHRPC